MQNFQKNTSKNPKPEIPANIKIPIPLKHAAIILCSIIPAKLKILKQNCVGGNPKFAKIK